ncbi:MAG: alpha-glucosidase C-terminal domain-containing protein, partial [bacterium]
QLTYVGAPMIFYGDEGGMWGGANPDNIKPMLWKEFVYERETYHTIRPQWNDEIRNVFDPTLFRLYGKLNKIRHENPAIQKGDFAPTILDNQKSIYAYARKFENNEVVVFLNMSEKKQIIEYPTQWKNGSKVKELLNEKKYKIENGTIKLELDKKSGAILVEEK